MRLVWGFAKISRGNRVKHIAKATESEGLCGRRLGSMYEVRASVNEIGNLCSKCREKYVKDPELKFSGA